MTANEVLQVANRSGVRLSVRDGRLRCDSQAGVMTPMLRDQLRAFKPEILDLLARGWSPPGDARDGASGTDPGPGPRADSTGLPWRNVVGGWSIAWRQRWGEEANRFAEDGIGWPEDESLAFEVVLAEKLEVEESVEDSSDGPG